MTTSKPPARYGAKRRARERLRYSAQLHHSLGHDRAAFERPGAALLPVPALRPRRRSGHALSSQRRLAENANGEAPDALRRWSIPSSGEQVKRFSRQNVAPGAYLFGLILGLALIAFGAFIAPLFRH